MKILVVDDERTLVKGIKFNLENEGYEVECAYDGAAAVELAQAVDRRDEVSGVVVDEEVANVMLYNKSLSAASRLMTALDEALDVLINRTGRVGL